MLNGLNDVLRSFFDGSYPVFALPAAIVIVWRICKRQWTMPETIILGSLVLHAILEVLQTYSEQGNLYVSKRYLLPCAPILFGWTAYGLYAAYQWIAKRINRGIVLWVIWPLIVWHALVLIFDGIYPTVKVYNSKLKNSRSHTIGRKLSPLIREDYKGPALYSFIQTPVHYETGYRPLIASDYPSAAYFCGGTTVPLNHSVYDYIILPGDALAPADHILKFSIHEGATDVKVYAPQTPPVLPVP